MFKYFIKQTRQYIFIILTATIFLNLLSSKSFCEENIFIINDVEIEGPVDINFSRENYIDKVFVKSFKILMSKVLLSEDLSKVGNININEIKNLIKNFQVLKESYKNNYYKANFKINYNEVKLKKYLSIKNISFSEPKKIKAVFFPALYLNEELQNYDNNYFFLNWNKIKIKNESIDFVLPIEDLDDIPKLKNKNYKFDDFNIKSIVNKYNLNNYVFALINYKSPLLKVYLKTKFNDNKISKNISYKIDSLNNEIKLKEILEDLKMQITDIWKKENIINLAIPLSLEVKFKYSNLASLYKLKNTFYKIGIIKNHSLNQFNMNYAIFNINYYGNPKKLKTELLELGFKLTNNNNFWEIYKNE
jgi:hypothetical protein